MVKFPAQNFFKKSFFRSCFEIAGLYLWVSLFVSVAGFVSNILIIVILYKIFNQQSNTSFNVEVLLALIVSRFLTGNCQLLTENQIRKKFCNQVVDYFKYSNWMMNHKPLISTLISRDILLLLDTIPAVSKLFYFPICFTIGTIVIYKIIGLSGVIAISTVVLFVPFSLVIARKSIQLASEIYRLSKLRLEEVSKWLEWRSIINNWVDGDIPLKRITMLTEKEVAARNLDSIWRCADQYLIIFGRCLPVAIVILITMILKDDISNKLVLTMWLSVPFIALVMEAGRFATDFQLGKQALVELQKASKPLLTSNVSCLVLDNSWEIWDGTLSENCLADSDNFHFELLNKLRLDKELMPVSGEVYLSRFGTNISDGQKTRILIIRAIHLAIKSKVPLKIKCSLDSLDPDICHRLMGVLESTEIADKITLSKTCEDFLAHQILRKDIASQIDKKHLVSAEKNKDELVQERYVNTSLLKDLFIFINPFSLIFLFPAMGLSLVGYISIINITLANKLIIILVISMLSFTSVIFLGAKSESHTRQWAKIRMLDILLKAQLKDSVDIFQRLSRDFTTLIEKISWYVHDITWLSSLLLVSSITTIITFGVFGILIVMFFLIFSISIWKFFEVRINKARMMSVYAVNQTLIMGENLICYGALAGSRFLNKKRNAMIKSNIYHFYQSNVKLISLKIIFSNLIMCVSGLFILATLIGSMYSWISDGFLIFILTAILSVDASISILFQALSGFSAQRASIHRLLNYQKHENNLCEGLIVKNQHNYLFNGGTNPNTGVRYRSVTFESGNAYSMLGKSGIGKSQFLKLISGLYENTSSHLYSRENITPVLYVNKEAYKIDSWVKNEPLDSIKWTKESFKKFVETKILKGLFKIIVLDEALVEFDVTIANEVIHLVKDYISMVGGLLIFVDHRFTLEKSISISDIQISSTVL